jgi:crotonobetainyl-CoA:carnitine CoA-transferase CaiB-like acyl-CoA transferase
LFRAGGREDLIDDARVASGRDRIANADSLYQDAASILATNTTDHWIAFCRAHQIPASRVVTVQELVDELPIVEHPITGRYHQIPPPVRFSATPSDVRRHAPLIGQHGPEILAEVGYTPEEIAVLQTNNVLREH